MATEAYVEQTGREQNVAIQKKKKQNQWKQKQDKKKCLSWREVISHQDKQQSRHISEHEEGSQTRIFTDKVVWEKHNSRADEKHERFGNYGETWLPTHPGMAHDDDEEVNLL